ncbi:hypothetical protein [Pseudomonas abietaniphila]|uniref:glutamine--fructose-6-phosphate transaminase (isomerizing) n=1 Tax=Pseudomonas abietaniphila TaxID=89065 RepID=A0A1G8BRJ3_9PSED|nr:hypothetical protein [Pseudomonas abietaniphila]SDH35744.1 Glutamine amidotransferase domain-containing protein [Pseudomonas abietaniphila]
MCGIFGLAISPTSPLSNSTIEELIAHLFKLSESRGSEAAGIAIGGRQAINVYRRAKPASEMMKAASYKQFIKDNLVPENRSEGGLGVIGHSRLVTNGTQGMEENNQPVSTDYCVGVHNGIIVNDAELWEKHPKLSRKSQVDTEVIYRLIDETYKTSKNQLTSAVIETYGEIKGEANIAFLNTLERKLCLATNVGSIYYTNVAQLGVFIFASERHFLKETLKRTGLVSYAPTVEHLKPNTSHIVNTEDLSQATFNFLQKPLPAPNSVMNHARIITDTAQTKKELRRCSKCVLPHTFPYIIFDVEGVCNYCREAAPSNSDNRQTLEKKLENFRSIDGSPDCIVALSGGRDSCYGLHVVKKELGLNPIAYTYDWAMVTDEARRNSARVCSELGVEHIIRSADILSKRRNIRLNIQAWMKNPQLGMIPLFMAGDKQFFHYATQVSKQTGVPLVIFCGGNNLEVTRFKTGFCGVQDRSVNTMVSLDLPGKLKLLAYYAKNFLKNPAYLNRSIFDTLFAFYSTYVNRQEFLYLYRYVNWDEKVINDTLSTHYGWENSSDAASTWRIGDGTAAFYNYIYHTVAGFSEHDTFRSNQIRAGLITREEALSLVKTENKPRYAAMQEYSKLVGFSLDEALVSINNIEKLY